MNQNHNEYKTMNVIRNYWNIGCALLECQLASIYTRTDVYEAVAISV